MTLACSSSLEGGREGPAVVEPGDNPAANPETGTVASCAPDHLLPPRIVRLSGGELREHVRRALPGTPAERIEAIDLQADHLAPLFERIISGAEFGAYYQAALGVAQGFVAEAPEMVSCRSAATEEPCLNGTLRPAVSRLFRAEPSLEGWSQFEENFRTTFAAQGIERAASSVIAGALLSPQTLYHTELGAAPVSATYAISNSEALKLARFALTGRGPEPTEVALTELEPEAFKLELSRLAGQWTQSSEFTARTLDFVAAQFGVQHIGEVDRTDEAFTPAVKEAMTAEFRQFVGSSFLSPSGTFYDLFAAPPSVFPGLESIYGTEDLSRRKGVLGLASLLSALAAPSASDPVKRGILVRVELLCEPMPPPIPDADFGKVMVTEDMQTRERFEALASMPACQSCHQVINPPGYLFEEFDHLGRHRSMEKGRPINASGTIPPFFGGQAYAGVGDWDGIVPLAEWLASAPEARSCFATHFASYLLADLVPHGVQNCSLPTLVSRFAQTGQIAHLAEDLVQSELFFYRTREAQ